MRDGTEFYNADDALRHLSNFFKTESDPTGSGKPELPEAVASMLDRPLAMEALGGMLFYLDTLNLGKDLVSQKNFNIYDPIKEGRSLVLDGQTLGHMEVGTSDATRMLHSLRQVLVNSEGGTEGTLLELLQRCQTAFGRRDGD